MSVLPPFAGISTALYTPFHPNGRVDEGAFAALCDRVASAGSGLVPCGTTGETPTLSDGEYLDVVRIAVDVAAGRVPVIAGTGGASTEKTVAATAKVKELGVDAALVVTPPYNRPPQVSLLAHFRAVADVGLPVVLYNVPARTGTNLLPETTLALAADPRFVAIKEACGNIGQIDLLVERAPERFAILSGDDSMTLPLLAVGGHGLISVVANVAPRACVAMVNAGLAGDLERARAAHRALVPLIRALFATSSPIPLKHVAAQLGHCTPTVRLPLTADAVGAELSAELRRAMEAVQRFEETLG
ncbi:MAG: 4-hydroxy-tetrahydrodipicolinate synthase [Myxococcales bacterium]|nr:4-hydroxy-tetrahydrodipicolinate synthase [Myxococcales bacterium]